MASQSILLRDSGRRMNEREALEWIVCIPWIGGREPTRCPVCHSEILTPNDIKQCIFGHDPDIVHKVCWAEYNKMIGLL